MSAGVVHVARPPRCGCCDALGPIALCERCQEPVCARHLERLEAVFICTLCRQAIESVRLDHVEVVS